MPCCGGPLGLAHASHPSLAGHLPERAPQLRRAAPPRHHSAGVQGAGGGQTPGCRARGLCGGWAGRRTSRPHNPSPVTAHQPPHPAMPAVCRGRSGQTGASTAAGGEGCRRHAGATAAAPRVAFLSPPSIPSAFSSRTAAHSPACPALNTNFPTAALRSSEFHIRATESAALVAQQSNPSEEWHR